MPALFHLEIHTPYRLFFSGEVESISLQLSDGEIGIYANHSSICAPVLCCILRIKDQEGLVRPAFIRDGILEVTEIKTLLLVDTAEWPDEIDTERTLAIQEEAHKTLESAVLPFEHAKAQAKLRRAALRLQAAGYGTDTGGTAGPLA